MDKATKPTSAHGLTGFILDTFDGRRVFRVYTADRQAFQDYLIRHGDLEVTIVDTDAFLYHDPDRQTLDYSPQTRGIDP